MKNVPDNALYGDILIIDDDLPSLQIVSRMLLETGHDVRGAQNGSTALTFIEQDPPELILLDIRMADMDGFEVCRRLRAHERSRTIPIIFLSALDKTEDKIRGFQVGGTDYITKPFQAEEVLARVEMHLSRSRALRQVEEQNTQLRQEIRKRDQAEKALQHAHDTLEQRVKERTIALERTNMRLRTEIEEHQQTMEMLRQSQENHRILAGKLLTAQEAERRRLAREMHDDLTQRLAVQAIEIGKIEAQAQDLPDPLPEKLRDMKAEMMKLSEDIHAISRQLHPSIIDDLGLVDAISSKCQRFTEQEGIVIDYTTDSVPSTIPRDIALGLYRILQEGLQNIAKHAQTSEASVSLRGANDTLELALRDHGIGFDPVQGKQFVGLGLVSMAERVHLLQGEWVIRSQPGEGTMIKVRVPLK